MVDNFARCYTTWFLLEWLRCYKTWILLELLIRCYTVWILSKLLRNTNSMAPMVKKIGPDRPVGPVQPWTGSFTGLTSASTRPDLWTGQNRHEPWESGEPVEPGKPWFNRYFSEVGLFAGPSYFFRFILASKAGPGEKLRQKPYSWATATAEFWILSLRSSSSSTLLWLPCLPSSLGSSLNLDLSQRLRVLSSSLSICWLLPVLAELLGLAAAVVTRGSRSRLSPIELWARLRLSVSTLILSLIFVIHFD